MVKISTIKERILSFLECNGIKKADFYQITGVADSNFKGRNLYSQPGSDVLVKILTSYPNISAEWLLTGNGSMLKTNCTDNNNSVQADTSTFNKDKHFQPNNQHIKAQKSTKGIPLIPIEAVAGFPAVDSEGTYLEDYERYAIPEFEAKGANFLIRVSGDSMTPLYNNGDIIACRKITDILFLQWGSIYVLDTSQGALVKRVEECEKDDDSILCISENPRFKPFQLPKSDIRSLSTIIGLVRLV